MAVVSEFSSGINSFLCCTSFIHGLSLTYGPVAAWRLSLDSGCPRFWCSPSLRTSRGLRSCAPFLPSCRSSASFVL